MSLLFQRSSLLLLTADWSAFRFSDFAIRRDARSKRFKCPRCNVWAHGNPVNFHEHVQNECTEPWPTVVPASAEVRGPGRPRKSAAAAREEEEEDEEAGDEEGAAAGEAAANGEEKDADMADETAEKSVAGALCAEGETSEPKDEGAGGAADSQAGEAAVAPADGPLPGTIPGGGRRQREVPRRESTRSLRAKPVKVMKEWGSDDEDDAFMMSGEDAPYEEDSDDDDDHVPVSQVRRKKRASTANSDGTRVRYLLSPPSPSARHASISKDAETDQSLLSSPLTVWSARPCRGRGVGLAGHLQDLRARSRVHQPECQKSRTSCHFHVHFLRLDIV